MKTPQISTIQTPFDGSPIECDRREYIRKKIEELNTQLFHAKLALATDKTLYHKDARVIFEKYPFFSMTLQFSMKTVVILVLSKCIDENRDANSIPNIINYIETNRKFLETKESLMLDGNLLPVAETQDLLPLIQKWRGEFESVIQLKDSIKLYRDKYYAHLDKKQPSEEEYNNLSLNEVEEALNLCWSLMVEISFALGEEYLYQSSFEEEFPSLISKIAKQ